MGAHKQLIVTTGARAVKNPWSRCLSLDPNKTL